MMATQKRKHINKVLNESIFNELINDSAFNEKPVITDDTSATLGTSSNSTLNREPDKDNELSLDT